MESVSDPSTKPARPPQVTFACGVVMVGSVFVVLMMWDRIAGLHTLDSRHRLQSFLDDSGLDGNGFTVSDLMVTVKVLAMIAAGCATAMVILGWQTLQRSRGARVGLAILAVPLFLTGMVSDGIVSSAVAAAVITLWFGPARIWFSDGSPEAPTAATPDRSPFSSSPTLQSPAPPPAPQQTDHLAPQPPPWTPPPTSPYAVARAPQVTAPPQTRPQALVWACLLTWFSTSLTALGLVGSLTMLLVDSQAVLDRMHEQNPQLADQGISDQTVLVVALVMCAALLAWTLAAAAFAALLFRRHRWAWYALVVSTVGAAALCLLGVIGSLVMLAPLAATLGTMALLVRPEIRAWLTGTQRRTP
jgi:hypothetical protein